MTEIATDQDRALLRRALGLAENGRGRVSPNPLVGAVIARDGEPLGEGFHARLGGLHAETAALADARERGNNPAGATMYVTLEPCAHQGRQPACAEAIVEAGIARVVIASDDPSEKASGRGPGVLRDEGVDVAFAEGAEATAARLLNQPFRKHARTGRPLVTLKMARSLDGRTAPAPPESPWISGPESRRLVHRWRAEADAVAVGIGTALADDPLLTAREVDVHRQPLRVVFDSEARLPLDSRLLQTLDEAPALLIASPGASGERLEALRQAGAEALVVDGDRGQRLAAALADLGRRGVTSLLLEGGAELAGAFLDAGEVDELCVFIAPVILGGSDPSPFGGAADSASDAAGPLAVEWACSGDDLLARARLREW